MTENVDTFLLGSVIFSTLTGCLLAHPVLRKADKSSRKDHDASIGIENAAIESSKFIPGELMPNFDADDDLKFYLGDKLNDERSEEIPSAIDAKDIDTPDKWIPRHQDLVRLTGRHPLNCEAPLKKLFDKGFITPPSLHYVRNHGAVPVIEWGNHIVSIGGLAPKPLKLKMTDIIALPRRSLPVTLVCCGNRRKEQNMIKQSKGFNWGAAGVSTGVWTGARLCDILKLAGIDDASKFPNAHVRFASENEKGGDKLPGGVYGTSVPLSKAVSSLISFHSGN
jgi:nitrate reductase (NAD(P)H)